MRRITIIAAAFVGFAGAAFAANGPTMDQCKAGWKADYSKMWTKTDFTKACQDLMKNGGKM
jgi:hypothetical protein